MNRSLVAIIAAKLLVGIAPAASASIEANLIPKQHDYLIDNPLYSGSVDIYELEVRNYGNDATSVELSFLGDFLNHANDNRAFRDTAELPTSLGQEFPDTFFVLPESANVLAAGTVDTATQLSSSFTLPGATPIFPSGGEATTIAFLTVPTGGCIAAQFGRGAVDGMFVDLFLGVGGVVVERRRSSRHRKLAVRSNSLRTQAAERLRKP